VALHRLQSCVYYRFPGTFVFGHPVRNHCFDLFAININFSHHRLLGIGAEAVVGQDFMRCRPGVFNAGPACLEYA